MGGLAKAIVARSGISGGDMDKWAELVNKGTPYSYNVAKSPYDVWSGKYTQIRPRGATYANPEGIEAGYNKAMGGLLGQLDDKQTD